MSRLEKIEKELLKAREKAAEWQAKVRDLEKQKQEEENIMIVQAVRSLKLTPAELLSFLDNPNVSAPGQLRAVDKPPNFVNVTRYHDKNLAKIAEIFQRKRSGFPMPWPLSSF